MAMVDGKFAEVIAGIACAHDLARWLSSRAKENTLDGAMLKHLVGALGAVHDTLDDCIQDSIRSIKESGYDKGTAVFEDLLKQYKESADVE